MYQYRSESREIAQHTRSPILPRSCAWAPGGDVSMVLNNPARASPPLLGKLNPILAKPGQELIHAFTSRVL